METCGIPFISADQAAWFFSTEQERRLREEFNFGS